ncbi:MAG: hypothetical protein ABDH21_05840 [bacterium]
MKIPRIIIRVLAIFFIVFWVKGLIGCATSPPTLSTPTNQNTNLLSISVFLKGNRQNSFNYQYNSQNYNYKFYLAIFFRFDDNLLSNNLDLTQYIMYFQNGFRRIRRINPPSANTPIADEWSTILVDNNSQLPSNKELRFNIVLPDTLIGNVNFFKFIILVFLRDYEYQIIADDFGQDPVHYFNNPSHAITINLSNIQQGNVNSLTNPFDGLVDSNLPPGFPDNFKDSLKIEKIEYVYRSF